MGFFIEDSGLIITHILYKAALVLTLSRWAFSWALRFRNRTTPPSPGNDPDSRPHPSPSPDQIRESLTLTTYGDITARLRPSGDTCAVCLSQLRAHDEVRDLRNCCHVFHRECIDRWVDHDEGNWKTCPLCRAPLLNLSQSSAWTRSEPSWAMERILYLFGDDLLT